MVPRGPIRSLGLEAPSNAARQTCGGDRRRMARRDEVLMHTQQVVWEVHLQAAVSLKRRSSVPLQVQPMAAGETGHSSHAETHTTAASPTARGDQGTGRELQEAKPGKTSKKS